jgi:nicotinic acid phosphoribosyltransferase
MKRQHREVYGFGARFNTRRDLASRAARIALIGAALGMLAGVLWT